LGGDGGEKGQAMGRGWSPESDVSIPEADEAWGYSSEWIRGGATGEARRKSERSGKGFSRASALKCTRGIGEEAEGVWLARGGLGLRL
jgi:hypothetical protein